MQLSIKRFPNNTHEQVQKVNLVSRHPTLFYTIAMDYVDHFAKLIFCTQSCDGSGIIA